MTNLHPTITLPNSPAGKLLLLVVLPVAALATGMALGLVINFDDAMAEEWLFAGGAVLAGSWIVVTALVLWRRFERQWFPIAGRVLGAWLMAIGLMLGAFHLIPPPG